MIDHWQRLFRRRGSRNAIAAVVIAGPAAVGLLSGLYRAAPASAPVFAVVAGVCAVVVALWRRTHDWVAVVVACATFVLTELPYPVYVMTFSLSRRRRWTPAVVCMAVLLALPAQQAIIERRSSSADLFEPETGLLPGGGINGLVYWALAAVAPFVMGLAKNSLEEASIEREHHAAQAAERQRRLRESTLRERSLTARARMASMMHDGVGHHVSVMVTTAGAISVDAAATASIRERAELIVGVGQKAVAQLAEVLDTLAGPSPVPAPTRFAVDDVPDLVQDYRSLGVDVAYAADPACAAAEGDAVDLCYRIVREGLTNALRYAGESQVEVRLTCAGGMAQVAVTSPLAPPERPALPGTGRGLRLLADEVARAGGSLAEGPEGDVFVLRAELPLAGPDDEGAAR
ncbi:sensor histidine kinase [Actinokineospora sp. NPDC004072]